MDNATTPITTEEEPSAIEFAGEAKPQKVMREFLVFEVDEELFAVPVEDVDQVLRVPPITTVPNAGGSVAGIFHLRGRVIVAIDLERRLGFVREKPFAPSYLFITHRNNDYYAILIDRPYTVLRIAGEEIVAPDPLTGARIPAQFLGGSFMYDSSSSNKKKKERSILIEPTGSSSQEEKSAVVLRPVIVLLLAGILNGEEIISSVKEEGKV